eukprot:9072702-Lingulodinium_polyedra.AAC.1
MSSSQGPEACYFGFDCVASIFSQGPEANFTRVAFFMASREVFSQCPEDLLPLGTNVSRTTDRQTRSHGVPRACRRVQ